MPMSAADRQKKYIEKLKRENPEKYEEKRKKHLQKVKDRQKKVRKLTDEEKQKQRKIFKLEFMWKQPTLPENSALQGNSSPKIRRASTSQSKLRSNNTKRRIVPKKLPSQMTACKQQIDETFDRRKSLLNQSRELDEYDHFAFMIAAKLRKINNDNERETLMFGIQNLVYESMMKTQEIHAMPKRRQSNAGDTSE